MGFRVEVSPRALADLDQAAAYITANGSFERAQKWFNRMIEAMESLRELPHRCPIADESVDVGQDVRVMLCGAPRHAFKVFYAVQEKPRNRGTVQILHVRHWAQRRLTAEELEQLRNGAPFDT